jgi:hypothetical protein
VLSVFVSAVLALGVALTTFLAGQWLRVTARDRNASRLRQLRDGLDWNRSGHRSRIAAGVSRFGELRGQ